jgi:hypothetical protein
VLPSPREGRTVALVVLSKIEQRLDAVHAVQGGAPATEVAGWRSGCHESSTPVTTLAFRTTPVTGSTSQTPGGARNSESLTTVRSRRMRIFG